MTSLYAKIACVPGSYYGTINGKSNLTLQVEVSLYDHSSTVAFLKERMQDSQFVHLTLRTPQYESRQDLFQKGFFLADLMFFAEINMEVISAHFLPSLAVSDLRSIITTQNNDSNTGRGLVDVIIGHKEVMEKYLRTGSDSLISPRVLKIYSDEEVRRSLRPMHDYGED